MAPDPTFEEMRKVVVVDRCRPAISRHWNNDEVGVSQVIRYQGHMIRYQGHMISLFSDPPLQHSDTPRITTPLIIDMWD